MNKFKRSALLRHPDDAGLTLAGALTPGILPIWLIRKRIVSPQIGQAGVAGPAPRSGTGPPLWKGRSEEASTWPGLPPDGS
jgi:hypothetical protein